MRRRERARGDRPERPASGPERARGDRPCLSDCQTVGLSDCKRQLERAPENGVHDAGAARQVRLPLNNPTSVAIGSDALYITTARHRLSEQERAEQARPPFVLSGHAASLTPY
jgi:hypothetical protein